MRPTKASVTQTWLLYTQLCLWKDLIISYVRHFIRRAKSMLLSHNMVADSAEISVIDVKSHISVGKDPSNFQIAEIRIHDSICIEIPSSEETPLLGSVKSCSAAATIVEEPVTEFVPNISSGSYADKGDYREYMEDEHICIDDLSDHLGSSFYRFPVPIAFYGVFDGHGGSEASQYIKENAMRLFFEDAVFRQSPSVVDSFFLKELEKSHREAYRLADLAMDDERIVSSSCGTTALTALVIGRHLMVANAGDCRAVLCRKGKAVDMSYDHKSTFEPERRRVEDLGGYFEGEYLYGDLAVTRALGDWSIKRFSPLGGSFSPLISDPDIQQMILTEEDEFLIMGCDGIWDVMTSQYAVTFVRQGLRRHGDPRRCAMELGREALRLDSSDNVTVVVICFSSSPAPQRRRIRFCVSDEARARLQTMLEG
ncbi:PPM-type phosphatase domain superfamily [Arabidopsis thaliana x Arabidopsis arenosa]|uniref:protein-serine/threonine phosphatase n=1 Tax=Arabidopsis thaliana x Arabidopsis arenosa TaxID=1240361 RepID=A0A8T2B0E8_9BRAS|nr:PPM-type phosphatase domain superfamily [Arabidopsis thaliana x Arabidopsis arenosa]